MCEYGHRLWDSTAVCDDYWEGYRQTKEGIRRFEHEWMIEQSVRAKAEWPSCLSCHRPKSGGKMISLCMVVRNEAETIGECLDDIEEHVQEIVIVDQSSDDRTIDIVKKYTDRIFVRPDAGFREPDRQFSINQAMFQWILILDPDERLDNSLKANLRQLVTSEFDAYWIWRKDVIKGEYYDSGGGDWQLRLFKKHVVTWPEAIHAYPLLNTEKVAKVTNGHIIHLKSFEHIKRVDVQRNLFVDDKTRKKHEQFVEEVESWLPRDSNSQSKLERLLTRFEAGSEGGHFNLRALLEELEKENEYMNREEAVLRFLYELSKGTERCDI